MSRPGDVETTYVIRPTCSNTDTTDTLPWNLLFQDSQTVSQLHTE